MSEIERFPATLYGPAERRMAESLVEIERQALAGNEEDCDCKMGHV